MNFKSLLKKTLLTLTSLSLLTPYPVLAKVEQLQGEVYASVGINVTQNNETFNATMNRLQANNVKSDNIVVVDGNMINRYLNDGSNASTQVFSSSKVAFNDYESGVTVDIVTPHNINLVTQPTYINAAITSGIQNAHITVGSEVPVTGEGALVGIYAIMEREGVLDPQDAQVAQEEISLVTEATNQEGVEENAMNAMMADIKAEVAQLVQDGTINNVQGDQTNIEGDQNIVQGDQNNNYGTINNVVNMAMNNYGITLPDNMVDQIVRYAMNFATTDSAQSSATLNQLGSLANDLINQGGSWVNNLSQEAQTKWEDEQFQLQARGFFAQVSAWLGNLFSSIGNFFTNLFNSTNVEDLNFENPVTDEPIQQLAPEAAQEQEEPVQQEPAQDPATNQEVETTVPAQ